MPPPTAECPIVAALRGRGLGLEARRVLVTDGHDDVAVAHPVAEALALVEGVVEVGRHEVAGDRPGNEPHRQFHEQVGGMLANQPDCSGDQRNKDGQVAQEFLDEAHGGGQLLSFFGNVK